MCFRTSPASGSLLDGTRVVTDSLNLCYARPAIFKSTPNGWATGPDGTTSQAEEEHNSEEEEDDDDDMPPLEANTNRNRPFDVHSDTESDSNS